jgi:hypothetical protein
MARIQFVDPGRYPSIHEVTPFECCVYVIKECDSNYLKVGITNHPARRLSSLQCGNPRRLGIAALFEGSRASCAEIEKDCLKFIGAGQNTEWAEFCLLNTIKFLMTFAEEATT